MKSLFTLLCTLLFAVQFSSAQQTVLVLSKSGDLAAYSASKITFDEELFTFTYGDVTEVTKEKFSSSFSVALNSEYERLRDKPFIGICFSENNEVPTISDPHMTFDNSLQNYSFSIDGLFAGTTYYYRAFAEMGDIVYYGEVRKETTFGKQQSYKMINGHQFVDLGLPSGLLWAACNVGAMSPFEYGDFFAWGETQPKSDYSWDTYKYGKYLNKYNLVDEKKLLDKEDDAAYVNWGTSCRMPTYDELLELMNPENCTWKWYWINRSRWHQFGGYKVTSTKNGNSIFIPASGVYSGSSLIAEGGYGRYWLSTLFGFYNAYYLHFDGNASCKVSSFDRDHGFPFVLWPNLR